MPLYPASFTRDQIRIGAIDWSGQLAEEVSTTDLDPLEIARAKNILRRINPDSELLKLDDKAFLVGLGAVRNGKVTHAGLLLFGREQVLTSLCPQHQVHYVHLISDTSVARNDSYRFGLLNVLERLEWTFTGPVNPEEELSIGFFKLRIPAFPWEVVREAVLNAVTHRDYADPGEVLIRHANRELVVSNPGGFIGGITPQNILRHEPVSRNRTLAEAFEKLRLVEKAGIGRRRIFIPTKTKGLEPIRYAEMVKAFLADHGSITPQQCRELLGLGESDTAKVEVSRYLRQWSSEKGFLRREGKPPKVIYYPRKKR
jgi:ATP-dependent DNA helicase RecG